MKTKLYFKIDPYTKKYEFYHRCSHEKDKAILRSIYHREDTRYANKCPRCLFQIPSIYLLGGNNYEVRIFASTSTVRRGVYNEAPLTKIFTPIPDLL